MDAEKENFLDRQLLNNDEVESDPPSSFLFDNVIYCQYIS